MLPSDKSVQLADNKLSGHCLEHFLEEGRKFVPRKKYYPLGKKNFLSVSQLLLSVLEVIQALFFEISLCLCLSLCHCGKGPCLCICSLNNEVGLESGMVILQIGQRCVLVWDNSMMKTSLLSPSLKSHLQL